MPLSLCLYLSLCLGASRAYACLFLSVYISVFLSVSSSARSSREAAILFWDYSMHVSLLFLFVLPLLHRLCPASASTLHSVLCTMPGACVVSTCAQDLCCACCACRMDAEAGPGAKKASWTDNIIISQDTQVVFSCFPFGFFLGLPLFQTFSVVSFSVFFPL